MPDRNNHPRFFPSLFAAAPALFAAALAAFLRCSPSDSGDHPGITPYVDTTNVSAGPFSLVYNRRYCVDERAPVVVIKRRSDGTVDKSASGNVTIEVEGAAAYAGEPLYMKRGYGCALVPMARATTVRLRNNSAAAIYHDTLHRDTATDTIELSDALAGGIDSIGPDTLVTISSDLTIASGTSFTLRAGVVVLVGDKVNLTVEGSLTCRGSAREPILFTAASRTAPWGGITVNGSAHLTYTILTAGGGNTDSVYVRGHSNSQPVLQNYHGTMNLSSCFIVFNPGKGLFSTQCAMDVDSSLVAFCDMGGEFNVSEIRIRNSYFMFFPDFTADTVDDDNDALYFFSVRGAVSDSTFSSVEKCTFFYGKDDGIDHNQAFVRISDSWIEGFHNEGLAGSNENRAELYNCYITGCEQGVEAGYDWPVVAVNHCLIEANLVGVRFGDNYTRGCSGRMTVRNSIIWGNEDNIRNFDLKSAAPVDSGIAIYYSIIDSSSYEPGGNNITDAPSFSGHLLASSSPGRAAADDGLDMGLISEP